MIGKYVEVLLALSFVKGISNQERVKYARSKGGTGLSSDYEATIESSNLKAKISSLTWKDCLQKAKNEINKARALDITILSYLDKEYPINLLFLPDAPIVLYVKGNYQALNKDKIVAVIGSRTPSKYGAKIDTAFSTTLSKDGFVTVAGLAAGCDTYAHRATVKAKGSTVATLGNSLEQPIYPAENTALAQAMIAAGGALVSSFHFGTPVRPANFPIRDEWQSGLSNGVLAIETAVKGGTRIAMHHATVEKKPLAVIDYRQDKKHDLTKLPTFQGNLDSLKNEGAMPLFSQDSLKEFERKMMANREKRLATLSKVLPQH